MACVNDFRLFSRFCGCWRVADNEESDADPRLGAQRGRGAARRTCNGRQSFRDYDVSAIDAAVESLGGAPTKGTLPIMATTRHAPAARSRIADNAPARLARCRLRRFPATPTWAARFLGRNVSASPRKRGKRDDAVVAWGQAAARPRRDVWRRLGVFTDKRNSGRRTIPAQMRKASRRSKKTDCTDRSKCDVKKTRIAPAWKVSSFSLRSQRVVRRRSASLNSVN
jgi:hypothetical protein